MRLASLHNVAFLVRFTADARAAIVAGDFERFAAEALDRPRVDALVPPT